MQTKTKNRIALSLLPQILLVKWLSFYPEFIENYYSLGFYQYCAKLFRFLNGWIPFSLGDLLYAVLGIYSIRYLIIKRKCMVRKPFYFLKNGIVVVAIAYFTFNMCWGLNYHRLPVSIAIGIKENSNRDDLRSFVQELIDKTNETQLLLANDSTAMIETPYTNQEIFDKTIEGYKRLEKVHPFLKYENPSIKNSLFSIPLSYMGYGGYLNPFTNEAQVNSLIPPFRFPVISGHEVGHQLGYSAENETNLIGYLVTVHNEDMYFKYAAYAYALSYCLSDIKQNDEALFQSLLPKINAGVLKNYEALNAFWQAYENSTEPIFKAIFNSFLIINNQSDGIKSYSKVVLLMVSYHQKYPL
ncbi:DUF3810 domain-containing protein [Cellulophaga sp. Hel_I_12]|uniref:DUF3810 domain-containing protein n=1 Tax=Cellulophaga sp. Hel_I_12 TaxID=1249972 RepID=UPI000648C785|nr:DUF3810 domain-containing protein [Cellulophaga sp. Hel_I_12]